MRKGIIGIAMLAGILLGTVATVLGLTFWTFNISKSLSFEVGYNTKNLIEDKANFDLEKRYLENSLWTDCTYAAYMNGMEGTVYNDPWGFRCSDYDLSGNLYDYVCWRDLTGEHIPPEDMVTGEIFERIDNTFRDYFAHLEYVEMEKDSAGEYDITPLEIAYGGNELNLSYRAAGLNFTSEFMEHNINENGVWVNVTAPIRYMNLYWNASDFTQNSDERLNGKLISALENALVCTGDGRISEAVAINIIENELQEIALDEGGMYGNEFEWEMHLLRIHELEDNHPNYEIEFTILVIPRDSDQGRIVPNVDSAEKLGIRFAIKTRIVFTRNVQHLCDSCPDCTGSSNCGNPGVVPYCSGNSRVWWSSEGRTDDCPGCYCEKMEDCSPGVCSGGSCGPPAPTCSEQTSPSGVPCQCRSSGLCTGIFHCIGSYGCSLFPLNCCCCAVL